MSLFEFSVLPVPVVPVGSRSGPFGPAQGVLYQQLVGWMQPDVKIVSRCEDAYPPLTLSAGPATRLGAVLRCGRQEDIHIGIINVHHVVLVYYRERSAPLCEGVPCSRLDCNRALRRVTGEHTTEEGAQHRQLAVFRRAGMDHQ